jgi:hypothetical protein
VTRAPLPNGPAAGVRGGCGCICVLHAATLMIARMRCTVIGWKSSRMPFASPKNTWQ